jgi:predicted nucleic acid-binding protein
MKDQRLQIVDIVKNIDNATLGLLNVPEFQRKYVWRPSKVADLVDSLWRGYPIGTLLLWESAYDQPRTALGNQGQKLWIVDGQQRVTSLALLFGRKPYWWSDGAQWNKYYERYDVLVNIAKAGELEFSLINPVRRKSPEWLSVRRILSSASLTELAQEAAEKLGDGKRFAEIHEKLQSVRKIETAPLYEIIVDHELEDVAEIFARLNTAGTKIRESDIVIALVAAKQQGWIRQKFDPFLRDLELKGFEFDPSVIVRTLAIIGHGSARLRDVPQSFWDPSDAFDEQWRRTKEAISAVIRNLMDQGVLSSDLLPSLNVLIPVFVLKASFPTDFNFPHAFHWMLLATRDGRYSGSAITVLDQDTRKIRGVRTFEDAIAELTGPISTSKEFKPEDFREEYTDKFLRLILYLTAFDAQARDWINQDVRIGFDREDNELNEGFKPEWHHIFARKLLKGSYEESVIDCLANIAVLNEKANRSFSAKPPQQYLEEHAVGPERLAEQAVPSGELLDLPKLDQFLSARAAALAQRANTFLARLNE